MCCCSAASGQIPIAAAAPKWNLSHIHSCLYLHTFLLDLSRVLVPTQPRLPRSRASFSDATAFVAASLLLSLPWNTEGMQPFSPWTEQTAGLVQTQTAGLHCSGPVLTLPCTSPLVPSTASLLGASSCRDTHGSCHETSSSFNTTGLAAVTVQPGRSHQQPG